MHKILPPVFAAMLALAASPSAAGVNEWTSSGPYGGRIQALAVDPLNPSILFAAAFQSGIFKSIDGGVTWVERSDRLDSLDVQALAVHPQDSSTVYAATRGGVFRSTDGGQSWPRLTRLPARLASSLAIDPKRPDIIYVAVGDGVYRTPDGGASWSLSLFFRGSIHALAIDPQNTSVVYTLTVEGISKSVDSGASWFTPHDPFPENTFFYRLAIDPENTSTLFLGTVNDGTYRSVDGGVSWTLVGEAPATVLALTIGADSTVYAGTRAGVYRFSEGDTSWTLAGQELRHRRVEALAADPSDPSVLLAGTWGPGVFRSADGGNTWSSANHRLSANPVWSVTIDPGRSSVLYAATEGGLFRSVDRGTSWTSIGDEIRDPQTWEVAVHPRDPSILYVAANCCVYKSVDGGATWNEAGAGLFAPSVFGLAIDPETPSTLYAALEGGVFKSVDGAASWTHLTEGAITAFVQDVVVDPENPTTLYAAAGGVFRSVDGGASWTGSASAPANSWSLAVDPENTSTLYVSAFGDGVWKSVDGGEEWFAVSNGLEDRSVATVAVDPKNPQIVYAATENLFVTREANGVYRSMDGGGSWAPVSTAGLNHLSVRSMAIDPGEHGTLYAGTDQGGIFDLTELDVCEDDPTVLCLHQQRFLAEVIWRDFQGQIGSAQVVPVRSDNSGLFWFFDEDNWEMLVKVLDGCGINNRFWVFSAATTNVEYTLRVTDTVTGIVRSYFNPLGVSAAATTDSNAFNTCGL